MAYEKTKALLTAMMAEPEEIEELLRTYAEELAVEEPYATNSIRELESAGRHFTDGSLY